jgi:cytoskeletal protein CcmA (bactofilin family)
MYMACASAFAQMKTGDNVVVREPVLDDFYVAAGTVTIDAPIRGDLIVAGGTVIVNDTVAQDILVAGGNITLNGYVGDDVRSAGGAIALSNHVAGDLIVTGGKINLERSAVVGGDLRSAGGEVIIAGTIHGDMKNTSGEFILDGIVGKDLECTGGAITINGKVSGTSVLSARTITLGPSAVFEDDITYWRKDGTMDFAKSLTGGTATFDTSLELEEGKWHYLGFASFLMVLWYLGTALLLIIILHYLFGRAFRDAANRVKNESLKSLGFGFLFLLGVPVLAIVTMITIIGLPVGILLLLGYLIIVVMATLIVSLLISNWINNTYYQSAWASGRIIIAAFVIFIFLKLASLTPVIGPIIMLLLIGMAFGGILLNIRWKRNKALSLT